MNTFAVGDLVTRDGTDIHRVVDVADSDYDLIVVECIKAPASNWIAVGDRESNLARRYSKVMADTIEGAIT